MLAPPAVSPDLRPQRSSTVGVSSDFHPEYSSQTHDGRKPSHLPPGSALQPDRQPANSTCNRVPATPGGTTVAPVTVDAHSRGPHQFIAVIRRLEAPATLWLACRRPQLRRLPAPSSATVRSGWLPLNSSVTRAVVEPVPYTGYFIVDPTVVFQSRADAER